jgi:hypothetical protein
MNNDCRINRVARRLASTTAEQSGAVGILSKQAEIDKLRKALTIIKA